MLGDLGRRLVLGESVGVVEGVVYKVEQSVKLPSRERQKALHSGKVEWGGVGARNAELNRQSCNSPRRVVSMATVGSARQSRLVRTDLLLFLRHLDWLRGGYHGEIRLRRMRGSSGMLCSFATGKGTATRRRDV